jgi:hypothetical protein
MSDVPESVPDPNGGALPPEYRYAYNLPRGSIRGGLVLMIMVPFWVLIAWPQRLMPMPLYIYFLLIWVFVFIASPFWSISSEEGSTDTPAPFHLPKYTFHFLIAVVTVGLITWRGLTDYEDLLDRLTPGGTGFAAAAKVLKESEKQEKRDQAKEERADEMRQLPYLLMSLAVGFLSGWGVARILGKWRDVYWFQDIQATVSLVAMLGLLGLTIYHVISAQQDKPFSPDLVQYILVGVIAWYFGARS